MRQFTHQYTTNQELDSWLVSSTHAKHSSTLIQIFSGILDQDIIGSVIKTILEKLPFAVIIGTTTGGEILNGKMLDDSQEDILKYADSAMYQVKETGRNKVLFHQTV